MLTLALGLALAAPGGFSSPTADPAANGLSPERLNALWQSVSKQTDALLVIRHDQLVGEFYREGQGRHVKHYTASMAKAIVAGMSLALAMDDDRIDPDQRAAVFVPAWRDDPLKSKLTVGQLATHTSGIADAEQDDLPHDQLPGWKGAFWKRQPNPFLNARDDAPVLFEPGTSFQYSNPGIGMLGYCVAAALRGRPEPDVKSLLTHRLMNPLGVPTADWSMGYGTAYQLDGLRLHGNWGGGSYSPEAAARIGRLMLNRGEVDGQRLLSEATWQRVTADAGGILPADLMHQPCPTYGWWSNARGAWPLLPRDAFCGAGAGHQILLVVPSLELVVVRFGSAFGKDYWPSATARFLDPLAGIFTDAPWLPSPVLERVEFAPPERIIRLARGSDNWPLTAGDDGAQYTSYGDGWGFEPRVERKLSQGFGKVTGGPTDPHGENVRTSTGELVGDGAKGGKASGLLMVGGVLYCLVRNQSNTRLYWSADHGRTWQSGFAFTTSFGCPSFCNFGPNYAGARDDDVYLASSDGPSAYESYDGIVLARAPADRLKEQAAYEYYSGTAGREAWSRDIADRQPILSLAGRCQRLDFVYHPGLKRYLLALGYDHSGAWGIYDAPEPWGPYTCAFTTDGWDQGETHGYRLPTSWFGADGQFALVFSGRGENDALCVRQGVLRARK